MVFRRNSWILCSFNLLISVSFKFSEISMYYFCTKTVIMKIICTWVYVDFPSSKEVKNLPANAGDARDVGLIPGSEISPGGGNGHLLQYSCLGNPMDKGAWQTTVHWVATVRYDLVTKQQECMYPLLPASDSKMAALVGTLWTCGWQFLFSVFQLLFSAPSHSLHFKASDTW